jgi:hypothetical protein
MALMISFDRLMVGDVYRNNATHAWFVSSLAGASFGLILTALVWAGAIHFEVVESFSALIETLTSSFLYSGVLMFLCGALGVQILFHYFTCFSNKANSTAIASWIAATPIFIFIGMLAISFIIEMSLPFSSVLTDTTVLHPIFIAGTVLATFGLVIFEQTQNRDVGGSATSYRFHLVMMLVCNVAYTILLQQILVGVPGGIDESVFVLALLPLYWLGFGVGIRALFKKEARKSFAQTWRKKIRYYVGIILFVEVIGMLVFFFEYLGIAELDPTYVNIILGAHIFLVYAIDQLFARLRNRMDQNKEHTRKVLGMRIHIRSLPRSSILHSKELLALGATIVGIILASSSMM